MLLASFHCSVTGNEEKRHLMHLFFDFLVCRRNFGISKILFQQRANNGNSVCTAGKELFFMCNVNVNPAWISVGY